MLDAIDAMIAADEIAQARQDGLHAPPPFDGADSATWRSQRSVEAGSVDRSAHARFRRRFGGVNHFEVERPKLGEALEGGAAESETRGWSNTGTRDVVKVHRVIPACFGHVD